MSWLIYLPDFLTRGSIYTRLFDYINEYYMRKGPSLFIIHIINPQNKNYGLLRKPFEGNGVP